MIEELRTGGDVGEEEEREKILQLWHSVWWGAKPIFQTQNSWHYHLRASKRST